MATPVFRRAEEYTVHYDRGQGKREEINMGFTSKKETECGQCQGAILPIRTHVFFNTILIIDPYTILQFTLILDDLRYSHSF